ncbi:MAG: hypothetical protein GXO56_00680 [Chloroflexi bacterium]|nr:hypothetical protein [Chloroflexota bacterium]
MARLILGFILPAKGEEVGKFGWLGCPSTVALTVPPPRTYDNSFFICEHLPSSALSAFCNAKGAKKAAKGTKKAAAKGGKKKSVPIGVIGG